MTDYRRLPAGYWCDDLCEEIPDALRPNLTIYEPEDIEPTGVYDAPVSVLRRLAPGARSDKSIYDVKYRALHHIECGLKKRYTIS